MNRAAPSPPKHEAVSARTACATTWFRELSAARAGVGTRRGIFPPRGVSAIWPSWAPLGVKLPRGSGAGPGGGLLGTRWWCWAEELVAQPANSGVKHGRAGCSRRSAHAHHPREIGTRGKAERRSFPRSGRSRARRSRALGISEPRRGASGRPRTCATNRAAARADDYGPSTARRCGSRTARAARLSITPRRGAPAGPRVRRGISLVDLSPTGREGGFFRPPKKLQKVGKPLPADTRACSSSRTAGSPPALPAGRGKKPGASTT